MLYFAKWKVSLVLVLCLMGAAFASPNFVSEEAAERLPSWLPHKQINLGLDLQGGSHLLLEVEVNAVVVERLESLVDSIRVELRKERIGYTGLGIANSQTVNVRVRQGDRIDQAVELIRNLGNSMAPDIFGQGGGVDIEVSADSAGLVSVTLTEQAIRDRKKAAVEQSIEIVRRRVDE